MIMVLLGLAFIMFTTVLGWVLLFGTLRAIYRITNKKDDD